MPNALFHQFEKDFLKKLLFISVIGILLRVLIIYWVPTQPVSDAWSYFQRSINLYSKGIYEAISGRPDANYPPLYSIILSLFFHIPGDKLLIAKLVNAFLGGLSIFLIGLLGEEMLNQPVGLISAFLLAISPRAVLMANLIFSENLFLPVLLAWLLYVLQSFDRPISILRTIVSGIFIGSLALIRTIALALFIVWILPVQKEFAWKIQPIVVHMVVIALAANAVLVPWGVRNWFLLGEYTYSTVGGIDLYIGNNPNAYGGWYPWVEDVKKIDPLYEQRSLIERDRIAGELAVKWMKENPKAALRLYLEKLRIMFESDNVTLQMIATAENQTYSYLGQAALPGSHWLKNNQEAFGDFLNIVLSVTLFLEALGLIVWPLVFIKNNKPTTRQFWLKYAVILVVVIYFPVVSAVFLSSNRFTWPSIDISFVFIATMIYYALERFKLRTTLCGWQVDI